MMERSRPGPVGETANADNYLRELVIKNALLDNSMDQLQRQYNYKTALYETAERDLSGYKKAASSLEAQLTAIKLRLNKSLENVHGLRSEIGTLRALDQSLCLQLQEERLKHQEMLRERHQLINQYSAKWQQYKEVYERLPWVQDLKTSQLENARLDIELKIFKQRLLDQSHKTKLFKLIQGQRFQMPIIDLARVSVDLFKAQQTNSFQVSKIVTLKEEIDNLKNMKNELMEKLASKTKSKIGAIKQKRDLIGEAPVPIETFSNLKGPLKETCQYLNFSFSSKENKSQPNKPSTNSENTSIFSGFTSLPDLLSSLRSLEVLDHPLPSSQHVSNVEDKDTECQDNKQNETMEQYNKVKAGKEMVELKNVGEADQKFKLAGTPSDLSDNPRSAKLGHVPLRDASTRLIKDEVTVMGISGDGRKQESLSSCRADNSIEVENIMESSNDGFKYPDSGEAGRSGEVRDRVCTISKETKTTESYRTDNSTVNSDMRNFSVSGFEPIKSQNSCGANKIPKLADRMHSPIQDFKMSSFRVEQTKEILDRTGSSGEIKTYSSKTDKITDDFDSIPFPSRELKDRAEEDTNVYRIRSPDREVKYASPFNAENTNKIAERTSNIFKKPHPVQRNSNTPAAVEVKEVQKPPAKRRVSFAGLDDGSRLLAETQYQVGKMEGMVTENERSNSKRTRNQIHEREGSPEDHTRRSGLPDSSNLSASTSASNSELQLSPSPSPSRLMRYDSPLDHSFTRESVDGSQMQSTRFVHLVDSTKVKDVMQSERSQRKDDGRSRNLLSPLVSPDLASFVMSPMKTPLTNRSLTSDDQMTPMFPFGQTSSILSPQQSGGFLSFDNISRDNEGFNLFGSSSEQDNDTASNFFKLF